MTTGRRVGTKRWKPAARSRGSRGTEPDTGSRTPRHLQSERAACAWIPLFPVRAEERRRPELRGRPTAVLAPDDVKRVWQVSRRARHLGVHPGMTVSQAIGLCPSLTLLKADPVFYDETFAAMLRALGDVSPVIEPVELGRVFVGVDGLDRLCGDAKQQVERIAAAIQATGTAGDRATGGQWGQPRWSGLRLGWARGKFAAWVAAMRARPDEPVIVKESEQASFLRSQPLASLPVDPDTHRRLWLLGLQTLEDLTALPEDAVVSQFGREGRLAWRLASGLVVEPVIGRPHPEPIGASMDFPTPLADRGIIGRALGQLVRRALRHPRRIGWRVHTLRARATLEGGASWMVEVTLKEPSATPEHITFPLDAKLEQASLNGGVEHLAVALTGFARGTEELQLFTRDAASAARAGRRRALRWAAKEIKTRLKHPMLHHVIEVHPWSRIPERRYALIDFEP